MENQISPHIKWRMSEFLKKLQEAEMRDDENLRRKFAKKYQMINIISCGHYSRVMRAKCNDNNSPHKYVAIKLLKKTNQNFELFRREVEALRVLNAEPKHKNVITYIDHQSMNREFALILELGKMSLRRHMSALHTLDITANIISQFITGVRHIHSLLVSHRDLKPDNMILTDGNVLKICDFGFSCVFIVKEDDRRHTICGSLPYMAPEIFKHSKKGYATIPADVWAIGAVTYEFLHKHLAFGGTYQQLKQRVMKAQHYPYRMSLPRVFKKLIDDCFTIDPQKRPSSNSLKIPVKKKCVSKS